MRTNTVDKVLYGVGILILVSIAFLASEASWASGGNNYDDDDSDVDNTEINIDVDADANAHANADADASADASATNDGNTVTSSTNIDARRPGTTIIGGGDSTASDQKVFAISGGWLTGSAGIRWDWTDKEARVLRIADGFEADGLVAVADDLRCSLKRIYKAVGGSRTKCNDQVDAERLAVSTASQGAQAGEIADLRRMVMELSERSRTSNTASQGAKTGETAAMGHNGTPQGAQDERTTYAEYQTTGANCDPCPDCSEEATRAFKACVSK